MKYIKLFEFYDDIINNIKDALIYLEDDGFTVDVSVRKDWGRKSTSDYNVFNVIINKKRVESRNGHYTLYGFKMDQNILDSILSVNSIVGRLPTITIWSKNLVKTGDLSLITDNGYEIKGAGDNLYQIGLEYK